LLGSVGQMNAIDTISFDQRNGDSNLKLAIVHANGKILVFFFKFRKKIDLCVNIALAISVGADVWTVQGTFLVLEYMVGEWDD